MELFTDRYASRMGGELSCFERIIIAGTIPRICYAAGMTRFRNVQRIPIFNYSGWVEPLR